MSTQLRAAPYSCSFSFLYSCWHYVDVDDRKQLKKFIKDNDATQRAIELRDLKEILHAIVVEDEVDFILRLSSSASSKYEVEIIKFISDRLNQKNQRF